MNDIEIESQYVAELLARFNWQEIVKECVENSEDEDGEVVGYAYLGTVFNLLPSRKYYTPFASGNVTDEEIRLDGLWWDALTQVANDYGLWIESGDDPCDILVGMTTSA